MSARDEFVAKLKGQLDELNAEIGQWEGRAREAEGAAREKLETLMADLRSQARIAQAKLDEVRAAGEDSWETASAKLEKLRDAFVHSFNYFKSQLK